jgi:hypothetical protein
MKIVDASKAAEVDGLPFCLCGASNRAPGIIDTQSGDELATAPDRMHLNLDNEQEVIATAAAFCVTPQELRDAVVTVGTDIAELQEHFQTE